MKQSRLKRDNATTRAWEARSSKPLKRTAIKPGCRKIKARMSSETLRIVWARTRGRCCCGCGRPIAPPPMGFHHVFAKAKWPEFTNDPTKIVGVSANCHANQETGYMRLPRSALIDAEQGMSPKMANYLDRTYGPRT